MFKTIIGIPNGETTNVIKICKDIEQRDPTFSYEIFEPAIPKLREKFENLLVLYFPTKDIANRWGGWFKHKCRNAKLADYFWVKEF